MTKVEYRGIEAEYGWDEKKGLFWGEGGRPGCLRSISFDGATEAEALSNFYGTADAMLGWMGG